MGAVQGSLAIVRSPMRISEASLANAMFAAREDGGDHAREPDDRQVSNENF